MSARFLKLFGQAEKGVDKALWSVVEVALTKLSRSKENLICGATNWARLLIACWIWVPYPRASKSEGNVVHAR
jgi:hypothetical protein